MAHRPARPQPHLGAAGPKATTVRYDYLKLLLDQLNKGKKATRSPSHKDEFDFEAPADENGTPVMVPSRVINAEINGRLTMRDVILVQGRRGRKVLPSPKTGHFAHLLVEETPGGRNHRHPGLDRGRRQGAGQQEVPLRQHPSRGVRPGHPGAQHPFPTGVRAGSPGDRRTPACR